MSASEAATAFPSAAQTGGRTAIETEALAQGLLLVRASALGVVRLQLAMERRDRPAALQTVDELMLLDRRISDFVGDLGISSVEMAAGSHALENQRRVLMTEKFALAAGACGPRMKEGPVRWIDKAPSPLEAAGRAERDEAGSGQGAPDDQAERGEARGMSTRFAVALALLAVFAAAAAFLFLSETGRGPVAAPAVYEGAPQ
jgi:hypothetical protein